MMHILKADRANRGRRGATGLGTLGGALVLLLGVGGCDFDVSNPGPVADEILDDVASHAAVVGGLKRAVTDAWNQVWLETAAAAREIMGSGNLNISVFQGQGVLTPEESNAMWSDVTRARWIGDDGVRRIEETGGGNETLAEAHLWAGFAYRLGGENMCFAVFDGGPAESHEVFLNGAIDHFTAAMDLAGNTSVGMAARAGRATAQMTLGNWSAAASDATGIPEDFTFKVLFSSEEPAQNNFVAFYVDNSPYRVHSVWNTPHEQYYLDSGDPRTPWDQDPGFPYGEVQRPGIGNVPWYFQLKFPDLGDDVNLVSGREMILIRAEAMLAAGIDGDWEAAMNLINGLRASQISDLTGEPLEPWEASNATEAWTHLRRERGIELWLEARRLNDLRRWRASGTPGLEHPLENENSGVETYLDPNRDLCVPIGENEVNTNTNLG
jgi:hypothetical protein